MDWSRAATVYDWQLPLERPALAAAVALAEPHRDEDLLDVGTGTGALLRELVRRPHRPNLSALDTVEVEVAAHETWRGRTPAYTYKAHAHEVIGCGVIADGGDEITIEALRL